VARLFADHAEDVRAIVAGAREHLQDPRRPLAATLETLFDEIALLHRRKPELYRLLARTDVHRRSDRAPIGGTDEIVAGLIETIRERPDVTVPDPVVAAHLVTETARALSRWLVHEAPPELDRRLCAREAVRLLCGYLSPPAGSERLERTPATRGPAAAGREPAATARDRR
jgi:hypothetical protein